MGRFLLLVLRLGLAVVGVVSLGLGLPLLSDGEPFGGFFAIAGLAALFAAIMGPGRKGNRDPIATALRRPNGP